MTAKRDHVVAISTIVTQQRRTRSAAWIGALWGLGHTITIFAVGVGIIVFTLAIPPRVGLSMELSVGLMLVLLGLINLLTVGKAGAEAAAQSHDDDGTHEHTAVNSMDRWFGGWTVYQWLRPLIVGLVHGLAGSAAIALLVLTTLRDSRWAVAYLLVFGVGTIAGMMLITVTMAAALQFAGARSLWIHRNLSVATGILSVAFGLFVVYQMGFRDGLFTGHPVWTPR